MKAEIAVATVSGKAYYLIVNELRKRDVPFLSVKPSDPIPVEIKAVITTKDEKPRISHERILVYEEGEDGETLASKALQMVRGKQHYARLVIGVDPGDVLGLAVLVDGKAAETANCFSIGETVEQIRNILKNYSEITIDSISVKIGDGVPPYKAQLLDELDSVLPRNILLESVREAGTNRHLNEREHKRGLRDIASATKIAGRRGRKFERRMSR